MVDFDIKYCPHCGEEIDFVANTCPDCGEDLTDGASYCPNCGAEVDSKSLDCPECGKEITEDDVDKYNQLSQEEKTAKREAYLQKKSEKEAEMAKKQIELEERREKERKQMANNEALNNEVTQYIKTHIPFNCKLQVSVTHFSIEIKAIILHTGYTLSRTFNKTDKDTALSKFVQALTAIYEIHNK